MSSSVENKVNNIYESESQSYTDEDEMHEVYRKKKGMKKKPPVKKASSGEGKPAKMTVELIGPSVDNSEEVMLKGSPTRVGSSDQDS